MIDVSERAKHLGHFVRSRARINVEQVSLRIVAEYFLTLLRARTDHRDTFGLSR